MKITYIHQHFKSPTESGGTRSWEFARRAVADGHAVTIIAGGDVAKTYEVDGITVIQVRSTYANRMTLHQRIISFLTFMKGATYVAVKVPCDVIYCTSTPLTVVVPGMVAAILKRRPWIFEVRDLWPSVPARLGMIRSGLLLRAAQALEKLAYTHASSIVALSPSMREGILQTAPTRCVTLIPNGCDFSAFSPSTSEVGETRTRLGWVDQPVVVYAGSFGTTYRIPWLVELAAECRGRVRFQILGEGTASEEARDLAVKFGLDPADLLPGALPKVEVARRVSAATATISSLYNDPALQGNSLNKVFDSMAAGKPVFFNHDGWLSELMQLHGAGLRLPENIQHAARDIIDSLADEEWVKKAGQNSADLGRQQFDRDHLYQQFIGVLSRALSRHAE